MDVQGCVRFPGHSCCISLLPRVLEELTAKQNAVDVLAPMQLEACGSNRSMRMPRLSWNQTIWKWWSMMVSPCLSMCPIAILLSGLHYSLVELVWNFLWWPAALVPTQHCAQLFAPLQRMSCVSFTQTSRVNYWSTSCLWFDEKTHAHLISCHRRGLLARILYLKLIEYQDCWYNR